MFMNYKTEVISFQDFMSPPATSIQKKTPLLYIYSFLPPITIKAFFPVHDPAFLLFLLSCTLVAVIAFLEKIIAIHGFTQITDVITGVMKIALPLVGYALIFWFLFTI